MARPIPAVEAVTMAILRDVVIFEDRKGVMQMGKFKAGTANHCCNKMMQSNSEYLRLKRIRMQVNYSYRCEVDYRENLNEEIFVGYDLQIWTSEIFSLF